MPYKRPLRLLWAAFDHPDWEREACDAALPASGGRIEHRAATGAQAWDWADLVLTLDEAARKGLPLLPPRIQVRHLDLDGAADGAARRALVEGRVAGIVGGLHVLERSGSVDDP